MKDDGLTSPQADRIRALEQALRQITLEAAAARSALCETELVIRLDAILACCSAALDGTES